MIKQHENVVVTYRKERAEIYALQDLGITTVQADFSTQHGIEQFIGYVDSHFSGIRALIHNASDWWSETDETPPEKVMAYMLQIHTMAPYLINLGVERLLNVDGQIADLIHMTDFVQDKGSKKHIAYSASKAAMHNLTLSFAARLAPHVKVNSIAPALLMFNEDDEADYRQQAMSKSLMQSCPGAIEAVNAVDFLLNSNYITGRTLHLDGGRNLK